MPKKRRKKTRGGARPGSGRPAFPDGEARTHAVLVRLNDAEIKTLDTYAERHGYSRSEAVRALLKLACFRGPE